MNYYYFLSFDSCSLSWCFLSAVIEQNVSPKTSIEKRDGVEKE